MTVLPVSGCLLREGSKALQIWAPRGLWLGNTEEEMSLID